MSRLMNIRGKMALLIVAIVAVFAQVVLSAMAALDSVEDELLRLDQITQAAVDANDVLRRNDEALSDIVAATRQAQTPDEFSRVEAGLAQALSDAVAALAVVPVDDAIRARTEAQLGEFNARMQALIAARREVVRTEEALAQNVGRVSGLSRSLLSALKIFVTNEFARLREIDATGEALMARSARIVQLQSAVTSLTARLSDVTETSGAAQRKVVEGAQATLADVIRAASAISGGADDAELILNLQKIATAITGAGGLIETVDDVAAARAAFADATADVAATRTEAEALSETTSEAAAVMIRQRRDDVLTRERDASNRQAILAAAFSLLILGIVWRMIDVGVVRRIERLTAETRRIAKGDLARPVEPDGTDEIGQMAASLATFRDNAVELNRSNEELSNFAYVASHDLRSPLRAIRNLVDWTIEDAGDEISAEVQANLEMIRARADRLSRLLSDLLDYARAGQSEAQAVVVHLPGMVRDIAEIADPEHQFDIAFEGDRCLATYETPLRTMLLNLVSNAIKHHDAAEGSVVIAHEARDAMSRITVTDDGPGIPEQYQAKIFDLFQTLKSSDEVEGSGMGLALVKKLATELRGTVRLDSDPGQRRGCRFIIDIPIVASLSATTTDDSSLTEGVAA